MARRASTAMPAVAQLSVRNLEAGTGIEPVFTDLQSSRFPKETKSLTGERYQDKAGTRQEHDTPAIEAKEGIEKENPGALAGATGAEYEGYVSWFDTNAKRQADASRVVDAVLSCDQEDRILFLETILDNLRPGWPKQLNIDLMEEAGWWADNSSRFERKAYMLACYRRLDRSDKQSFLNYITGAKA